MNETLPFKAVEQMEHSTVFYATQAKLHPPFLCFASKQPMCSVQKLPTIIKVIGLFVFLKLKYLNTCYFPQK
jgi:hypothetical protein